MNTNKDIKEIEIKINNNTKSDLNLNDDKASKKLRPCCACPMTKKLRDTCIFEKGEENCLDQIKEHNKCLKDLGFIVDEKI